MCSAFKSPYGEPAAARSHLARFEPGALLLSTRGARPDAPSAERVGTVGPAGADHAERDGAIGLLAVGAPDTEVIGVSIEQLTALFARPEHRAQIAAAVDGWLRPLAAMLLDALPPKGAVELVAGRSFDVEEDRAVHAAVGVVWVLVAGAPVALTERRWMQTSSEATFEAFSTEVLIERDLHLSALDRFRTELDARIGALRQRAEVERRRRFELRTEADRAALSRTLERLGTVEDTSAHDEDPNEPALASACRAIGRALDAPITIPAGFDPTRHRREGLESIVRASGLRSRPVILKGRWWNRDNGPLLAFLVEGEQRHPVALLPDRSRGYVLFDPVSRGRSGGGTGRSTIDEACAATIDPLAHQFYRPMPATPLGPKSLFGLALGGVRRDLSTILWVGLLGGLLGLVTPIATGQLFDHIVPGAERGLLLELVLVMVAITFGRTLLQLAHEVALLRAESRMSATIQAAVWDRLLQLPVPFFRRFSSGDLAVRANGIDGIRRTVSGTVMSTLLGGVFSSWNLLLLFYYDVSLALAATGLAALSGVFALGAAVLQLRYQRALSDKEGHLSGLLLELIGGISKLRVSGTETRAFRVWADAFSKKRALELESGNIDNQVSVFGALFAVLSTAVIFWLVAGQTANSLSTGEFLAFTAAFGTFMAAAMGLVQSGISLLEIVPLYERARPILEAATEVDAMKTTPNELAGEIEVNHVSFAYAADRPLVLKDVGFRARPGEFVAIAGPSGSGKSTLLRLLLGFEQPDAGGIYYDGQALSGLDVRAVRSQLGVVLQNGQIMAGTIYQNIVGTSGVSVDEAWRAANDAAFGEDIRALPMGMHTMLSQGGGTLSGGQRQRLLIARALVSRPRIVFFDEATSALDNRTQEIVSRSLEQLRATRVVIAHRLSTIRNADRIVVLDRGRVAESGSYESLMQKDGFFASMAKRQLV